MIHKYIKNTNIKKPGTKFSLTSFVINCISAYLKQVSYCSSLREGLTEFNTKQKQEVEHCHIVYISAVLYRC